MFGKLYKKIKTVLTTTGVYGQTLGSTTAYPDGFRIDNCIPISIIVKLDNNVYEIGDTQRIHMDYGCFFLNPVGAGHDNHEAYVTFLLI